MQSETANSYLLDFTLIAPKKLSASRRGFDSGERESDERRTVEEKERGSPTAATTPGYKSDTGFSRQCVENGKSSPYLNIIL